MPSPITETDIKNILKSKLNIQLATIDEEGYPIIHPLWFLYDENNNKIYVATQKPTRKVKNISSNPNKIYFSIDDENPPVKGVKGRAEIKISYDAEQNLPIIKKIIMKYLGNLDNPLANMLIENTQNGVEILFEITPKFFTAWDFGKMI